jgi:intracellular septation protein
MVQQPRLGMRGMNIESSGHPGDPGEILGAIPGFGKFGNVMKLLADLLPIIAFFAVYKTVGGTDGVYAATATAIGIAAVMVGITRWRTGHFDRQQLITLAILVVLGGLTLALRDERYIKWKPSVVSWVMAGAFLASRWIGQRTVVERMFGGSIAAPAAVWHRLNLAWVAFFLVLGILNLHFAYHWSTEAWVNFKVFGTLGLSLAFTFIQALYLMRYDAAHDLSQGE